MKKLSFFLMAMLVSLTSFAAALGDGYEKVTNISNLTTGDRVVVYADAISKGVTGWNGNKDATVAESGWVEYLVEVASGGVYLKDETANNYIASPGNSNQFKYGTKAVCSVDANGVLKCNNRLLCQNGTYYRMYGSVGSYKPFYVYKVIADAGGDETEDLGDALKWSATSATVQMGADDNEYPTLTNDKNVDVIYSSESEAVATIDANGVVTLVKEGTTTISALYEGGEIDGVTYSAKNVSYTLTVKPAPLVIEPIEGGIIDILTHKTLAATSSSYANFTGKQAANENHSDAVYAGRSARNGNATQYSIQLNTIDKGRIATTTSGGIVKRVYVRWSTQATLNTNARALNIYGSNDAFTGSETAAPSTKIGTITFTTGAAEAYVDLEGDYKHILITGSGAIYMDEIQVTWVADETPEVPTIAAPTFSLAEDTYTEAQEVTLSAEEGTIYYTLDGTTPDAESIEYTTPIVLDECGTTTIKAIAISGEITSSVASATYTIKLPLNNSQANPYTEDEAIEVYNGGCYDNQEVYVKGVVANAQFYSSNTYTITLEGGFKFYYFYEAAGEVTFTENYIVAGDTLVACGKLVKHNETYELGAGCYLVERKPYSAPKVDISNTKETAYTVAEAIALIDDITSDLTKQVYVKGEISEVESFNETYGSITYWIQDEEGNKFECYGGLGLDQEKFTSVEDLVVGSQVIVYGTLKKYGSIYEFDANNYLVEYVAPAPTTYTVYCINSAKWDVVACHHWVDESNATTWPGDVMTKTEETVNGFDVYAATFTIEHTYCIFNNNNNGSQTGDLTVENGHYYYVKDAKWYASLADVPALDPLATDVYLAGEMNEWSTVANEFRKATEDATTASLTLTLEAATTYEFKVVKEGIWLGNGGTITASVEGWTFTTDAADNCKLTTDAAGEYVLTWDLNTNKLTVTYPELPTYSVTVSDNTGGPEPLTTGGGEYKEGENATVTASEEVEDWVFVGWMANEEFVANDPTYTFAVEGNTELVAIYAQVMEDEITNLVIDTDWMVLIGGPSTMYEVEVYLGLGEGDGEGGFLLSDESSVSIMGEDATWIDGMAFDIDPDANVATAIVVVEWDGSFLAITLAMSAAPAEPTNVVVTNAVATYDEGSGALKLTGLWEGAEVFIEIAGYDGKESVEYNTPQGVLFATPDIAAFGNEAEITVAGENITVVCEGLTPMWGSDVYNVTITTLAQVNTALDNVTTTVAPVKAIVNGQLVIIKNGVQYNATGAVVK